jgi:hypothetical protein
MEAGRRAAEVIKRLSLVKQPHLAEQVRDPVAALDAALAAFAGVLEED